MEASILAADASQTESIQKKLILDKKIRNGVNWFFWIAGLSLLNSILYFFGFTLTFLVGLGMTQFVDAFMLVLVNEFGSEWLILRFLGLGLDIGIAAIFILIAIFGRKRYLWPVIIGIGLYALDAVLVLLFQDYVAFAFHALALVFIMSSLKPIRLLSELEKSGTSEPIDSIKRRLALQQKQIMAAK